MNRVVITGIGVVSPLGDDLATFWSRLLRGDSAIAPFRRIQTERLGRMLAAEADDFDPESYFDAKKLNELDRVSQFAVAAARSARTDAEIDLALIGPEDIQIVLGSGAGGQSTLDQGYHSLYAEGAQRLHPLTLPRLMMNAAASQISMHLGICGEVLTVAGACASGSQAIGTAWRKIRSGDCKIALTGGTEACLTLGNLKIWEAMRVLSKDSCRPFSRTRNGTVLGEGAALLLLESEAHARGRGARIYAEIAGYSSNSDAGHITTPNMNTMAGVMQGALASAGLALDAIDYINAHGTATHMNDRCEAKAIRSVFGSHSDRLMVSSLKGAVGHTLGASGAFGVGATALALYHGNIPPTAGWQEADPDCALDVVPNHGRSVPIRAALVNSFAFGGINASLVLHRA